MYFYTLYFGTNKHVIIVIYWRGMPQHLPMQNDIYSNVCFMVQIYDL